MIPWTDQKLNLFLIFTFYYKYLNYKVVYNLGKISPWANEFHAQSILQGQLSLPAVDQICLIHEAMNNHISLKIH